MAIRYYHRELLGHSLTQSKEMHHEAIAKERAMTLKAIANLESNESPKEPNELKPGL